MQKGALSSPAHNLLVNCAGLGAGDRLLIVAERDEWRHYAPDLANLVASSAQELGIHSTIRDVPFEDEVDDIDPSIKGEMEHSDCTIFFARLGDQIRFRGAGPKRKTIVSYTLDPQMLDSAFGRAHHHAFLDLKTAIDQLVGNAQKIRVTCPLGTDFEGPGHPELLKKTTDTAITRFPMSVFAPVPAQGYRGQVAIKKFITGTCSKFYKPYAAELKDVLIVEFDSNQIRRFDGNAQDVEAVNSHYDCIAKKFALDGYYVHSWHAGIHPGCAYATPAEANYERWCSGAFGNPRILHFHTCGAYAPGEISWNIVDPTIVIDGIKVWECGRLFPERVPGGADILDTYPCARAAFDNPAQDIGI